MFLIRIEPQFEPLLRALGLSAFVAVATRFTRDATLRGEVFVTRAALPVGAGTLDVFFKQYRYERPAWRFWLRASKARREFENYGVLAALGVPVAQRAAVGEERDALGRLKRAWLITVAVPESETLVEFAQREPGSPHRRALALELARIARTIHAARFQYHDLVWRNILVSRTGAAPRLVLIDCPRGGVKRSGWRRHQLRDLASLDKSAVKYCRRTERLRFLLAYLGKERVDDEARALAHACVDYRRTRWPEDWAGK